MGIFSYMAAWPQMQEKISAFIYSVRWVVELSQFDIKYKPWTAIKAQILAYFIV